MEDTLQGVRLLQFFPDFRAGAGDIREELSERRPGLKALWQSVSFVLCPVLHQLDQKIIYPHYDFKHLTEKYFEIGMKLRACLKIQPDLTIEIGLHI